ncbi:MAG: flagellar motor protein MotB, partial [Pseudomonadota bacterium]
VAYADFVTAMMAFFLLLWLLNATSEEQLSGLADYFDPTLPISSVSGGGAGILGGTDPYAPVQDSGSRAVGMASDSKTSGESGQDGGGSGGVEEAVPPGGDRAASEGEDIEADIGDEARARNAALAAAAARIAEGTLSEDGHLRVVVTPDGLLIEIVDLVDDPLFPGGSADPTFLLTALIGEITPIIAALPNPVMVIGHTDDMPFGGPGYTNWELSADRANAARRLLIASGLAEGRIAGVLGRAATDPATDDPGDPQNRRIALKLLAMAPPGGQPAPAETGRDETGRERTSP